VADLRHLLPVAEQAGEGALRLQRGDLEAALASFNMDMSDFQAKDIKLVRSVSLWSVFMLVMPSLLINISLNSFLMGLGIYFWFVWTRGLDPNAGLHDLRNVLVCFIVVTIFYILLYVIPIQCKQLEIRAAKMFRYALDTLSVLNDLQPHTSVSGAETQTRDVPPAQNAHRNFDYDAADVQNPEILTNAGANISFSALVSALQALFLPYSQKKYTDSTKERYYPIPERNTPDDIRRRINRAKERSRVKQIEKAED
jgi:hypothetical protein